jgi:hypothetical protein
MAVTDLSKAQMIPDNWNDQTSSVEVKSGTAIFYSDVDHNFGPAGSLTGRWEKSLGPGNCSTHPLGEKHFCVNGL